MFNFLSTLNRVMFFSLMVCGGWSSKIFRFLLFRSSVVPSGGSVVLETDVPMAGVGFISFSLSSSELMMTYGAGYLLKVEVRLLRWIPRGCRAERG